MTVISFETVSLSGGPIYSVIRHMAGGRGGLTRFGLLLGAGLWVILFLLTLAEQLGREFLSIEIAALHVRLLVAIPLLFLADQLFDASARSFCASLIAQKMLPEADRARLDRTADVASRLKESWIVEAAIVAIALSASRFLPEDLLPGLTGREDRGAQFSGSLAAMWYWYICLPVFRIVVLRWALRLCLWTWLVFRISRSRLQLVGTHPDLAGGLGQFETVQQQLAPLVVAMAALEAAGLAELFHGGQLLDGVVYSHVATMMAIGIVVTHGPALPFVRSLYQCRLATQIEFEKLSSRYGREFEARWFAAGDQKGNELLGSSDIQSMADIATAFSNARMIKLIPVSRQLGLSIVLGSIVPFAPLAFMQFPVSEILSTFFQRLLGF